MLFKRISVLERTKKLQRQSGVSSSSKRPSSGRTLQPTLMGCLVLADRPEPSFFLGLYAHTKTRRVSDVRIQPTQANAQDDTGVYFWATSEALFRRLQWHRYLAVANKYHLYPGCLLLVPVSRKKNTDRHGNGNQKSGRLLLLQILQSDGQSERADFSHTRVRSRKAESA